MSFLQKVGASSTSNNMSPGTEEFTLRVSKSSDVKYQMMKFNSKLNIDYHKWSHANMERDANELDGSIIEEDMPKFGSGSEFGRQAKQKARKRRYVNNKKVSESRPWTLKIGGKKFRGVREGGITDNSSYYLFTHGEDGMIKAHKLEEFYNFQPVQQYKTLTSEEAEEEFIRRNNVLNHFTLMVQKRLKNKEEEEEEVNEDNTTQGKKTAISCKSKELKISEMEDWEESEEDKFEEEEEDEEKIEKNKIQKQKSKVKAKQKKKSKGSDESATEESDDGDEEGRELDYISDSSDDVSNDEVKVTKGMQGVSEEKALKSLLTSDEDEDENIEKREEKKSEQNNINWEEDKTKEEENQPKKSSTIKKNKKTTNKKSEKDADLDCDSSDMDGEPNTQRPFSLVDEMENRNIIDDSSNQNMEPTQKKVRFEFSPVTMPDTHGITEEAIRRYLSRKPITTTQLLTKFKNRCNLSSEQLVRIIAVLLKRINPEKKMIKKKMYLSLIH